MARLPGEPEFVPNALYVFSPTGTDQTRITANAEASTTPWRASFAGRSVITLGLEPLASASAFGLFLLPDLATPEQDLAASPVVSLPPDGGVRGYVLAPTPAME